MNNNFNFREFLRSDLSNYNIEDEGVRIKDIRHANYYCSSTGAESSLFDTKMKALMDYMANKLSGKLEFDTLYHKLSTPQKKIRRTNRTGYKILHDDVKILKVYFSSNEVVQSDKYLYVIPYTNKFQKTSCKINLAVVDDLNNYLREVKSLYYTSSDEYCLVNAFPDRNDFKIEMDDDFGLNAGRLASLLINYEEYVKDSAQVVIKETKKRKMVSKVLISGAIKRFTNAGFKVEEYYNTSDNFKVLMNDYLKISINAQEHTNETQISVTNKTGYSAFFVKVFEDIKPNEWGKAVDSVITLCKSFEETTNYLESLQKNLH